MKNIIISSLIALLSGFFGFSVGKDYQHRATEKTGSGCQVCELNVTGQITNIPGDTLFAKPKMKVSIYFNGLDGISGILDSSNNGIFVGQYKGKPASAVCSGAGSIT